MATHHSTTKRTKSPDAQIVVPDWGSVWQSFKEERQKTTLEQMYDDGWKTIRDAAKDVDLSVQRIRELAATQKMDSIKCKVSHSGKTREMVFVRPKV